MVLALHHLGEHSAGSEFQRSAKDGFKVFNVCLILDLGPHAGDLLRKTHQQEPLLQHDQEQDKVLIPQMIRKSLSEESSVSRWRLGSVTGDKCAAVERKNKPLIKRVGN